MRELVIEELEFGLMIMMRIDLGIHTGTEWPVRTIGVAAPTGKRI